MKKQARRRRTEAEDYERRVREVRSLAAPDDPVPRVLGLARLASSGTLPAHAVVLQRLVRDGVLRDGDSKEAKLQDLQARRIVSLLSRAGLESLSYECELECPVQALFIACQLFQPARFERFFKSLQKAGARDLGSRTRVLAYDIVPFDAVEKVGVFEYMRDVVSDAGLLPAQQPQGKLAKTGVSDAPGEPARARAAGDVHGVLETAEDLEDQQAEDDAVMQGVGADDDYLDDGEDDMLEAMQEDEDGGDFDDYDG